jgi:hypothetical protein
MDYNQTIPVALLRFPSAHWLFNQKSRGENSTLGFRESESEL